MLKRGRISEGWLGELYAGEDAQGRQFDLFLSRLFSSSERMDTGSSTSNEHHICSGCHPSA